MVISFPLNGLVSNVSASSTNTAIRLLNNDLASVLEVLSKLYGPVLKPLLIRPIYAKWKIHTLNTFSNTFWLYFSILREFFPENLSDGMA